MKFAPIHMIHKFSLLSSFIVTSVWQFLPKAFFFREKTVGRYSPRILLHLLNET